jgi:hypothetical protein
MNADGITVGMRLYDATRGEGVVISIKNPHSIDIRYDSGISSFGVDPETAGLLKEKPSQFSKEYPKDKHRGIKIAQLENDEVSANDLIATKTLTSSSPSDVQRILNQSSFLNFHLKEFSVYHIGYYKPVDKANDPWTQRFLSFKKSEPSAVEAAMRCIDEGLKDLTAKINTSSAIVVASPGSQDQHRRPQSPVGRLANQIAQSLGINSDLTLVCKDPHDPLHRQTDEKARKKIIANANYRLSKEISPIDYVFVIDDIYTTGATISEICSLFKQAVPRVTVIAIVLGKTLRNNQFIDEYEPKKTKFFNSVWERSHQNG